MGGFDNPWKGDLRRRDGYNTRLPLYKRYLASGSNIDYTTETCVACCRAFLTLRRSPRTPSVPRVPFLSSSCSLHYPIGSTKNTVVLIQRARNVLYFCDLIIDSPNNSVFKKIDIFGTSR